MNNHINPMDITNQTKVQVTYLRGDKLTSFESTDNTNISEIPSDVSFEICRKGTIAYEGYDLSYPWFFRILDEDGDYDGCFSDFYQFKTYEEAVLGLKKIILEWREEQ